MNGFDAGGRPAGQAGGDGEHLEPAAEAKAGRKQRRKGQQGSEGPGDAAQAAERGMGRRLRVWLRSAWQVLDSRHLAATLTSCALIVVNALMLGLAGLAISSASDAGQLGWAFVPLVVTNLLSLTFAILGAQVGQRGMPDGPWALPAEQFERALADVLVDKRRLAAGLRHGVQLAAADLTRRQQLVRTACVVLLGGAILSALVFAMSLALLGRL